MANNFNWKYLRLIHDGMIITGAIVGANVAIAGCKHMTPVETIGMSFIGVGFGLAAGYFSPVLAAIGVVSLPGYIYQKYHQ
jgi:hypothetical protein